MIVGYALLAVAGAGYDALADFAGSADYAKANAPPSLQSWDAVCGTDWAGRSVLVKTILGAKVSMSVALISNLIAVPLGVLLGAAGGYFGKWIDALVVWLFSTLASIPGIILLIAIRFAFKGAALWGLEMDGIAGMCIALAMVSWINTARVVRAETMKLRELDYIVAARAAGRSRWAILIRHVLPNVSHLGIIRFSLGMVAAVQAEVILSYLGLGVRIGTPSWGAMINSARMDLFAGRYWQLTAAVTAMAVLVLALSVFGDRLRDALDPRLASAGSGA